MNSLDDWFGPGGTNIVAWLIGGLLMFWTLKRLYKGFVMIWSINQILRAWGKTPLKHSFGVWWSAENIKRDVIDK